jgi:hypothetical protein
MAVVYPDPLPVQTTTFNPTSIPHPLEHSFGDDIQLLGYDLELNQEQALLNLTLFWQSLASVNENYRVQAQLIDPNRRSRLTWLSHPINGLYPTRAWDKGDVIRDEMALPLAALLPNLYTIQVNLFREAEDVPLLGESLTITEFNLPTRRPLIDTTTLGEFDYRLWVDDASVRYRQTLALSWRSPDNQVIKAQPAWRLLGPDNVPRLPTVTSDGTAIFIVGANWPSGDYRLQLQQSNTGGLQTAPLLTVANEARQFNLDPLPEGYIPVEAVFAREADQPQIKLLGYTLPTRRVEPGGGLPLTLYWQSLAPVLDDTLTFAVLLDADLTAHGSLDRYASGFYSPMLWAQGEVVMDEFIVPVQPDAPPGVYALHLGQYRLLNGQPESLALLQEGELTAVTAVVVGPIKVGGSPPGVTVTDPTPQVTLNQPFGNQITLLGYDMSFAGDSNLKLVLYWRAETGLHTDYTTFLHLRNIGNETVAQKDSPPAGGRYPTSLWDAGEIVVDEIILPLDQVPPGLYTPVIGLYEFGTGTRLPVPGIPANEVVLESLELKE